jgi:hypothetical protein
MQIINVKQIKNKSDEIYSIRIKFINTKALKKSI